LKYSIRRDRPIVHIHRGGLGGGGGDGASGGGGEERSS